MNRPTETAKRHEFVMHIRRCWAQLTAEERQEVIAGDPLPALVTFMPTEEAIRKVLGDPRIGVGFTGEK